MTDWRPANSILALRDEVNAAYPDRPKDSDGIIGDTRHQNESHSDHNPNRAGVVTAWDITTAPWSDALAEKLRLMGAGGDARVKYVIWERRITSAQHAWTWAPYSGTDPHTGHIHLSVSADPRQYDRTDRWGVFDVTARTEVDPTPITAQEPPEMVIVYAAGKPTALLAGGRLEALKAGEKDAYDAAGIPTKRLSAAQFDLLDAVSHRIAAHS